MHGDDIESRFWLYKDPSVKNSAVWVALALALGAAVSLGTARFSYALLLPPMRDDLGWSYLLAGSMNTANAAGYLLGALTVAWINRMGVLRVFVAASFAIVALLLVSGWVTNTAVIMALRILIGVASAYVFVSGGLLAAQLASSVSTHQGFLLSLYYGGPGLGIAISALAIPFSLSQAEIAGVDHAWQRAWVVLGLISAFATFLMIRPASCIDMGSGVTSDQGQAKVSGLAFGLSAYFMFGLGYIGYMTFIIARLYELGFSHSDITRFYVLLGVSVMVAPRVWASALDRFRGGQVLMVLNALLAFATAIPLLLDDLLWIYLSGILFGLGFLSAVASTTQMVRHNLPRSQWAKGIGAFTTIFAVGQIIGPTVVGWIADTGSGLAMGLWFSVFALACGAVLASRQKACELSPN